MWTPPPSPRPKRKNEIEIPSSAIETLRRAACEMGARRVRRHRAQRRGHRQPADLRAFARQGRRRSARCWRSARRFRPADRPVHARGFPRRCKSQDCARRAVRGRPHHRAERRPARCHRAGRVHFRRSRKGENRERHRLAARRWRHRFESRLRGPGHRRAGESRRRADRPADLLSPRCHARLPPLRLQLRRLPRLGARAGRLSPFALRLRPRGRPLPPHPRTRRTPHQSRAAGRFHAPHEMRGRRAAHRRQAF